MPWILTGPRDTFTAATISFEEQTTTNMALAGETTVHRSPVIHLEAVIIHNPDGDKTPVQGYTLHSAGSYEITWTPHVELELDGGAWMPVEGGGL